MRAFENIENKNQPSKQFFIYHFLDHTLVYIGDYSMSMFDVIDWLSSNRRGKDLRHSKESKKQLS